MLCWLAWVSGALVVGSVSASEAPGSAVFVRPLDTALKVQGLRVDPGGRIFVATKSATNWGARYHADGTPDVTYLSAPEIAGSSLWSVISLRFQEDGKLLVAGELETVESVPRRGVVRLNADGTLDRSWRFEVQAGSVIEAAEPLPDGRVLVAGQVKRSGAEARGEVLRLAADGVVDGSFRPPTFDSTPRLVALADAGRYWIAGFFLNVEGQYRPGLVRLLADGAVDPTFATPEASRVDGFAYAFRGLVPLTGGGLLAYGAFDLINGVPRHDIVQLTATGAVDPGFEPSVVVGPEIFRQLDFVHRERDGRIVVVGNFTRIGQQPRPGLARLYANGNLDTTYVPEGVSSGWEGIHALADDSARRWVNRSPTWPGSNPVGLSTLPSLPASTAPSTRSYRRPTAGCSSVVSSPK